MTVPLSHFLLFKRYVSAFQFSDSFILNLQNVIMKGVCLFFTSKKGEYQNWEIYLAKVDYQKFLAIYHFSETFLQSEAKTSRKQ